MNLENPEIQPKSCECPICENGVAAAYDVIQRYQFYRCASCRSIFLAPPVLYAIDQGASLVNYDQDYWSNELESARSRSFGSSLARIAEALLYARCDVEVFLDIGTGPGFVLDACELYMPHAKDIFYGVELFPPPVSCTSNPNFIIGDVKNFSIPVNAGSCIEVIEHLTPSMISGLLSSLSRVATDKSLFIFNSGLPDYVEFEDPGYLDPTGRGHIVSYSVQGFDNIARRHGFRAHALPGKTWAFIVEKTAEIEDNIVDRIWTPTPKNRSILTDGAMGSVMYILGLESARAYR